MVPPASHRVSVSRGTQDPAQPCLQPLQGSHLSRGPSQTLQSHSHGPKCRPTTPACCQTGLGSSAFARHYLRNHCYFLLLWVLRCFSSPRSLSLRNSLKRLGCPIRTSTDQFVLADPRGFSQLITSFFASESLGIPRAPLITYFYLYYR